jgi:hypothetical protein
MIHAEFADRENVILCDAVEGCGKWYHFDAECEDLAQEEIDAIKLYACTGCLKMGLGETTYKVFDDDGNEVTGDDVKTDGCAEDDAEDVVEDDDEDEQCSEYNDEIDEASDSGDSAASDDYQAPITVETRKRKAASQPAPALPVQKKKKAKVSGCGAKKKAKVPASGAKKDPRSARGGKSC